MAVAVRPCGLWILPLSVKIVGSNPASLQNGVFNPSASNTLIAYVHS